MTQSPQPTITWEFLLGFGETWRLWIPLLFLLVWVGWLTRRWWGGRLLLVSLVLLAIFAAKVTLQEQKIQRSKVEAWNRLRVRLPKAEKIDGLQLEAGTIVRWDKEHEGHLITAELGHGQMVAPSVVVSGEVRGIADEWWRGNLVHDAVIRG